MVDYLHDPEFYHNQTQIKLQFLPTNNKKKKQERDERLATVGDSNSIPDSSGV